MITHVLVPLDGSDASEEALAPAAELAERFDAKLSLMTVMLRFPESRIHVPKMDEHSVASGQSYLAEVVARQALGAGTSTEAVLGTPAEAIIEFARGHGVDLIVMSTHGTTGSDRTRHGLGSVAWKLLHNAPCAIYLVPIRPVG